MARHFAQFARGLENILCGQRTVAHFVPFPKNHPPREPYKVGDALIGVSGRHDRQGLVCTITEVTEAPSLSC